MNQRSRLIANTILVALSVIVLSACGTTSAATLSASANADAESDSEQPLAGAPQQSLQTQGVTQTIEVTPYVVPTPLQFPGEQYNTPAPGEVLKPIGATPTPGYGGETPIIIEPIQPVQPVYPSQPVYPPQPAYPPISVPPVQVPVTVDKPGVLGLHIVQPGETLYCIGRAYQVDPIAIAQANSISGYAVIVPGHALLIPATKWAAIPAGPICRPQFAVDWSQPSSTSVTAVPLCGYVAFNYPAPVSGGERESSANTPPLVSTGSFANGYGETFALTVTGRRPDAIMAFTSNTPVCVGASRPQPSPVPQTSAAPLSAPASEFDHTPALQLSVTDILTDPNTFNLVIEFELTGAASQRYGPATSISFAIDPSIAPNATHYFYAKYRSSALAYLTANAGGITGALLKDCRQFGASQTLVVGQFNLTPLFSTGSAYYALTVVGRPGAYGFNGYNVAGTWGNLEAVSGAVIGCP